MAATNKSAAPLVPTQSAKGKTRIAAAFGLKTIDVPALIRAANAGLSWSSVKRFLKATGLNQQQLADYLDIPNRTFARRREAGSLDRRESEKVLRLAEIWEAALELFDGDDERTRGWLLAPAFGLGNATPIDYARTEFGGREVRALIGRIADGVFS
ncbi:MAG TPA: antitoxin Xre-like helix-turn-helix domain-containing protein [Acidobacteriaceae bacterium]|nr:antitoxin Xre-like helix-turn-helix domain-containing protein [Acidobacteriaceae bacterium]